MLIILQPLLLLNFAPSEEGGDRVEEEVKLVGADLLDRSVRRLDAMIEEHHRKIGDLKKHRENLREELKTPRSHRGAESDLKNFELKLKETIEKVMKVSWILWNFYVFVKLWSGYICPSLKPRFRLWSMFFRLRSQTEKKINMMCTLFSLQLI